ncbi:hypothetical protein BGX28_006195 [Mortierella sp. GBA30]|nr:hypothetical protein BGX28_006195 [Mortierella sp. GBA30]
MELHAHYIRKLTVQDIKLTQGTFYRNCSGLRDLILAFPTSSMPDHESQIEFMADMIRGLPGLRKIILPYGCAPPSLGLFLNAISGCRQLFTLDTSGSYFPGETMVTYMCAIVSTGLRSILSTFDTFDHLFIFPEDLTFPCLQHLSVSQAQKLTTDTQLEWISRCPNLLSLRWASAAILPMDKFSEVIPIACPQLTALNLNIRIRDEDDVASILNAMPRIEKLSLGMSKFSKRSMVALRRHFPWLKDIFCYRMTSPMIQEILCSCRALQSIRSKLLTYEDIVANPKPWVCNDLQKFAVGITLGSAPDSAPWEPSSLSQHPHEDMKEGEEVTEQENVTKAHIYIYDRLAQLTNLQDLSMDPMDIKPTPESGLDALAKLKHIRRFKCARAFDALEIQEVVDSVEWMLRHWTHFEVLGATFLDVASETKVRELLRKRGVRLSIERE